MPAPALFYHAKRVTQTKEPHEIQEGVKVYFIRGKVNLGKCGKPSLKITCRFSDEERAISERGWEYTFTFLADKAAKRKKRHSCCLEQKNVFCHDT